MQRVQRPINVPTPQACTLAIILQDPEAAVDSPLAKYTLVIEFFLPHVL